jgi:glycosyltransferase involved in cell wall biosynthesis
MTASPFGVLIPTYNVEQYLATAIARVLAQTNGN